jgi:hypothetical protein
VHSFLEKASVVNNKEMGSELPSFEDSREVDAFKSQPEIEKAYKNNELVTRAPRVPHASSTRSQSSLESLRNFQGEYGIWKGNMEEERNMEQEGERECKGEGEGIALTRSIALTRLFDDGNLTTVFEYWKTVLHHPQAKLDNKPKKLICRALKSGDSVEQLCEAIRGCSLTWVITTVDNVMTVYTSFSFFVLTIMLQVVTFHP